MESNERSLGLGTPEGRSSMESHEHRSGLTTPKGSSNDVQNLLRDFDADRVALARRMAAPWWLYPAFGVITALYVASPAIESDANRRVVVQLAMVSTIFLLFGYQRLSGVRVSRVGLRGAVILGVLVCATLALLSISFGLASFDMQWWIAIPAAVSFGLVVILGRRFDFLYRDELRRGR